ncbi:MAG: gamma-glutamyltransferase [Betaproteobacteria bacterium]|nr:gamma-glutamyltransferase [Betaproteobacteria bacterium]
MMSRRKGSHYAALFCFLKALCGLALALAAGHALAQPAPEPASGHSAKQVVTAQRFMLAAAHPLAVEAGYGVLRRGGAAIDAAIAMQIVLNLVEPQSSGIGGGAFILHYSATEAKLAAYDGRETAPAAARADRFIGADGQPQKFLDAVVGGKSVGTPGVLRALELAHAKYGKLPWAELFAPAIRLATEGFPLSPRLHNLLAWVRLPGRDADMRHMYYRDDDTPKPVGTLLKNPALADTLRIIAAQGANAFYTGEIARDIAGKVRNAPNPGDLSEDDLKQYRAKQREPVCAPYRQWKVCGMPPPSSGGVAVLQVLGMLQQLAPGKLASDPIPAAHLIAEAERLAYADRERYLADSDFVSVPVAGLLAPEYLAQRATLVQPNRSLGRALPGSPPGAALAELADDASPELPSTSHLSIVDADGNAVAMTTSIEFAFGSRQMVRGFLLNNQLTDFSFVAEQQGKPVANRIEPGKRPRSAMAPTMVFDRNGQLVLALGSAGGSAIINHVVKTLVAVLDRNMDIQQAIALPNFGSRNGPTELEQGTAAANWADPLRALGHEVRVIDMTSGMHGIMRTRNGWSGGADPRREGVAKGD